MKSHNFSKILVVLLILGSIGTATADVIEPGQKNVPFSYQITNIQDYPDYVFILHGTPNPSAEILTSSEFSFYKLSTCSVYAVPRTVFDSAKMDQMDETEIEDFLKNNTRVASSNLTLEGMFGTVNVADPLESALILLEINSIKDNNLDIKRQKSSITTVMVRKLKNHSRVKTRFLNQQPLDHHGNFIYISLHCL